MSYRNQYHHRRDGFRHNHSNRHNNRYNNRYQNGSNSNPPNTHYKTHNSFINNTTHQSTHYTHQSHQSHQHQPNNTPSNRRYRGYNPFIDNDQENERHKQTLAVCEKINKEYKNKAHSSHSGQTNDARHSQITQKVPQNSNSENDKSESYYYKQKVEPSIKSVPLIKEKEIGISPNSSPETLLSDVSPMPSNESIIDEANQCGINPIVNSGIDIDTFICNNNLLIQHHLESLQYFASLLPNENELSNGDCNNRF